MRSYFSTLNLRKAAALSFILALLSAPRVLIHGTTPQLLIPALYLALLFIAGAATAWGKEGGLPGLFPERITILRGLLLAVATALILLPGKTFILDPLFQKLILETNNTALHASMFPTGPMDKLAKILWAASFESMFFFAGTAAVAARLTKRRWPAVAACVILRAWITHLQCQSTGLPELTSQLSLLPGSLICAILYCNYGLVPVMAFSATTNCRLFFY